MLDPLLVSSTDCSVHVHFEYLFHVSKLCSFSSLIDLRMINTQTSTQPELPGLALTAKWITMIIRDWFKVCLFTQIGCHMWCRGREWTINTALPRRCQAQGTAINPKTWHEAHSTVHQPQCLPSNADGFLFCISAQNVPYLRACWFCVMRSQVKWNAASDWMNKNTTQAHGCPGTLYPGSVHTHPN